jgi:exopolysaccharide production protein ExoY
LVDHDATNNDMVRNGSSPPGRIAILNGHSRSERRNVETMDTFEQEVTPAPVVAPWRPRSTHRYRGYRLGIKRMVDVAVGGVLLIVTSPLLILLLVVVRLTSPGPALFRQDRVGHGGRLFRIVKIRTMYADAEQRLTVDPHLRARYLEHGYKLPLRDDPRITPLGAVLRRTSIDELPQLWNVLRGEMSLVGPRPVLAEELSEYHDYVRAYRMAKPGLTGMWQVAGRDAVRFPHRARLDADYIDQWSLTTDLVILAKTIPSALRARGVS